MVVIDSYQKRGLGTILLAVLYHIASIKGINILRSFILAENTAMSNWLGRLGAVGVYENDIIRMDLTVYSDLTCLPNTITARRFRNCIEGIG